MELSRLLRTTHCVPQEEFPQKPYNKSFIGQACSVKMARYWCCSFFLQVSGPQLHLSPFAFVTQQPYCPGRPKKLCFTTQSLAVKTAGARLSVVKQSFFGLPGQYCRRVTKANKHVKKELGQHPAILTSHLVNNPYNLPAQDYLPCPARKIPPKAI